MKLATHCMAALTASAEALIMLLNISPSRTQVTGPHEKPKQNTYTLAAISATSPASSLRTGKPSASTGDVPNTHAMIPKVTTIPSEPASNSGLRPNLSMKAIATNVVTILVTPVIIVTISAFSSVNPTIRHS